MQKLMLGTGHYKAMKTCIVHRTATRKSRQQPERAKRHREYMRKIVSPRNNPRNNKKPKHKEAVRASKRSAKIRELDWVERKQSHAEELVQPEQVKELQTFVNNHSNHRIEQLHSLFNAKLSDVVAVDSAVTTRGGGDKGENLYGLAAYSGASETWMGMGRCGAQNEGKWNVREWEKGGYDLRGPEHNDNMVLDKCVPEKDAFQIFIDFVGDATIIDYGGCDGRRINDLLKSNHLEELPFFNMCQGVCVSQGNIKTIFGPKDTAISRSVNGKLQTITDNLYRMNGQSYSQPPESASLAARNITPALTEVRVHASQLKVSDEVLDTQRLWNLFVALRQVYLRPSN